MKVFGTSNIPFHDDVILPFEWGQRKFNRTSHYIITSPQGSMPTILRAAREVRRTCFIVSPSESVGEPVSLSPGHGVTRVTGGARKRRPIEYTLSLTHEEGLGG